MVVLATVNCANYTQYQRKGFVTTNIPLARGTIFPTPNGTAPQGLTVKNYDIAGTADARVQWYPFGANWDDGSHRYLRIIFPIEITAGTDGAGWTAYSANGVTGLPYKLGNTKGYEHYQEKSVDITDDVTASVAHVPNATAFPGLFSQIPVYSIDANTPGAFNVPFAVTAGAPFAVEVDAEQNPVTGTLGTGIRERVATNTNPYQNIRTYKFITRVARGNNDVSFWATMYVEVGHATRHYPFWMCLGNQIFDNTGVFNWTGTDFTLTNNLNLSIVGQAKVYFRDEKIHIPSVIPNNPQGGTPPIYSTLAVAIDPTSAITPNLTSHKGEFCDGQAKLHQGVFIFDEGVAGGLEADTLLAEAESPIEAICTNWADHDSYGPYKYVMARPTNSKITTDDEGYGTSVQWANDLYLALETQTESFGSFERRDPWHASSLYSLVDANGAGNHPDYGPFKSWHNVRSGNPDLRAIRRGAYQEMSRPMWCRTYLVDLIKNIDWASPVGARHGIFRHQCRLFSASQLGATNPLGVGAGIPSGKNVINNTYYISSGPNTPNTGNWTGVDRAHFSYHQLVNYALISGDRWVNAEMIPDLVQITDAQTWNPHIGINSNANIRSNCGLETGLGEQSRSEGRSLLAAFALYNIAPDADVHANLIERCIQVIPGQWHGKKYADLNDPNKIMRPYVIDVPGSGTNVHYPAIRVWQTAFVPAAFSAAVNILRETSPINLVAANALEDIGYEVAKTLTVYCTRYQNGKWKDADSITLDPTNDPLNHGPPPLNLIGGESLCALTSNSAPANKMECNNAQGSNVNVPNTTEIMATWDGTTSWYVRVPYLYYDLALSRGDSIFTIRCKEFLESQDPHNDVEHPERLGIYGWGLIAGWTENAGIIDDPFRARTVTTIPITAEFSGFQPALNVVLTRTANLACTFSGSPSLTVSELGGTSTNPLSPTFSSSPSLTVTLSKKVGISTTFSGSPEMTTEITLPVTRQLAPTFSGSPNLISFITIVSTKSPFIQTDHLEGKFDFITNLDFTDFTEVPATNQSAEIHSGNDHIILFSTGTDLSGLVIEELDYVIYESKDDSIVLQKTLGPDLYVSNATTGVLAVRFYPVDTENLAGKFNHELEIKINGVETTLATGNLTVTKTRIQ